MTHPGREEESGSRLAQVLANLTEMNNGPDQPEQTTLPIDDFDAPAAEAAPARVEPPAPPVPAAPVEAAPAPAVAKKTKAKKETPAEPKPKRAKVKNESSPVKKANAKAKPAKKEPKKPKKSDGTDPHKRHPRDPGTIELQRSIIAMVKKAKGKPVSTKVIVNTLSGDGDRESKRKVRNALRGPQRDGILTFVVVEGRRGFVQYTGS